MSESTEPGDASADMTGGEAPVFTAGQLVAGSYEIKAVLGAGGMGEVYEAHDRVLDRRVALKVVRPFIDPDYLRIEGRALAAIHHPGIVTVHAMGEHEGIGFLVLERVRGLSIDRLLDERRLRSERTTVSEALDLLVAVADALSVVHRAGLSHRDVKPGNVMLAPGGRVVLMDFGLVLLHADRPGHRSVAGSLQYMAPEALTGEVAEGAAAQLDVYALGCLGFELLTGIMPFDEPTPLELLKAKRAVPGPRVEKFRPDVPVALREALGQLMAPDPHDRPQGAEPALWQLRAIRARAASGEASRPLSVLIVDDDEEMRDVLALYVRAAAPDAEIEKTGEGKQAVRSARRRVPDLLLLDLDLPDINGIEVLMLLRGMQLGSDCRVVSVSGRATPADVVLLEQLGVRSLDKGPTLMADVVAVIEEMRPAR